MHKQRAKEISEAPILKNVTYNGENIYIENVDEYTNMAQVHFLDEPGQTFEVPVIHLEEEQ